ncbi:hypothetical protein Trydic_g10520 [Trypoxylus dichotomus]
MDLKQFTPTKMECAVFGCKTIKELSKRSSPTFFFPFPKDANMSKAWKFACARPNDFNADTAKICQFHFDRSDFEKTYSYDAHNGTTYWAKLKSYAMPTLNLPKLSAKMVSANTNGCNSTDSGTNTALAGKEVFHKKCAVINCKSENKFIYDFPNDQKDKKMYLKWTAYCKNDKLKNMQAEELQRYGICGAHFQNGSLVLPKSVSMTQALKHSGFEMEDESLVASRLCRLCFDIGNVDLFSCRYCNKLLKDIVKTFIPIEIETDDASKKSLQVDEFFKSMIKGVATKSNVAAGSSKKTENQPVVEITDDEEVVEIRDEMEGTVVAEDVEDQEPSLLRQRLTMGLKETLENSKETQEMTEKPKPPLKTSIEGVKKKNCKYAPSYVLTFFHNYGKAPSSRPPPVKKYKRLKKTHLKNKKVETIVCIHCNKTIESLDAVQDHWKAENHDPVMICKKCNQMFKTTDELDDHSKMHIIDARCICERCGKQFSRKEILNTHLKQVHNKENRHFQCKVCSEKFPTKYRLKSHVNRIHTKEKRYCCEKCGAVFAWGANLRSHQMIHTDYKPHVCLICNKGFRRRAKLAVHLIKHTGERKFPCEICGTAFKGKYNLRKHNRRYHSGPNETTATPKKCTKCDFTSNSDGLLRVHMRHEHRRLKKEIYDCQYCQKRFANSSMLKIHMVVHTGTKKFECEICNKKFSQKPHLQSHLLVHTGEKPYKCKYCPKQFAHLSTLVVHERIHTGETPYVCQFCDKGYGHLTNYKKHVFSQHGVVIPKQRNYAPVKVEKQEEEVVEKEEEEEEEEEERGECNVDALAELTLINIAREVENDMDITGENGLLLIENDVPFEEES